MKDSPLVLLHGYPFDHTMWFSTIASMGANARVLAPDLPGFGRNMIRPRGEITIEEMAAMVRDSLDANGFKEAVVAGMSMGGYVALAFAELYPERLRGLGIISSQTAADSPEAREGRQAMIQKIRANGPVEAVEAMLPKVFSGSRKGDPRLTAYVKEGAQAAGVDGLCAALEAMAKRPDRTQLVAELDLPVLIVHGTDDAIVPVAKARDLALACQNPYLVEIKGAGHATPLEEPDQVAQALVRLMKHCEEERELEAERAARKEAAKGTGIARQPEA